MNADYSDLAKIGRDALIDPDGVLRDLDRGMVRAIAAIAPLIAKAERERCAAWHDEQAEGESALSVLAERDGDRGGERLHHHLANEHDASAAAIRALPDA
jgi:hypothetical protein